MLPDYYLTFLGMYRWMDYVHRVWYGGLARRFPLAEGLVPLANLWVTEPEHGGTITNHDTRISGGRLHFNGFANHPAIDGMRQGIHDLGIEVGDEHCRMFAL